MKLSSLVRVGIGLLTVMTNCLLMERVYTVQLMLSLAGSIESVLVTATACRLAV